jgi:DNA-binding beta-propeller fold protein YncE
MSKSLSLLPLLLPPLSLFLCLPLPGCSSAVEPAVAADEPQAPEVKAPELGIGDHSAASVVFTEIANAGAGLKKPRDLAFNPRKPDELWVVNNGDDSAVIIQDASTENRVAERRKDSNGNHFMAFPAGIAFGQDATTFGTSGTFATCGESRNTYDGKEKANDFTGPALWSSDLSIFAKKNPDGLGSHLDMLHVTPLCMGIAHQEGNQYWVFGGLSNSIDWYDFGGDHNVGQDDHSDGQYRRYVAGQVKYAAGTPSHLFYHEADGMLYVADTGNSRVVKLDTKSGTQGKKITPKEPMKLSVMMDNATLTDVIAADSGLVQSPSGLEIRNEYMYISDNANSRISAFTLEGERVNYLETGLPAGSLGGINFGPDGKLYFVDTLGHRVLRIDVDTATR